MEGNGVADRRIQIVYTEKAKWGMGGRWAFVQRKRSEVWEVTNCLYGAVREKSIDFRKILYRLFQKTL